MSIKNIRLITSLLGFISCSPVFDEKPEAKDFVRADGTNLRLGEKPYAFLGVNVCGLANDADVFAWDKSMSTSEDQEEQLRKLFGRTSQEDRLRTIFSKLEAIGVNAIRFCAFQHYTNGGNNFSALDRVVAHAEESSIKLMPVLANQWNHFPGDLYKDNEWYGGGFLEPQEHETLSYKEYVRRVVTRYRNSPAILMWQLMNEAQSTTPEGESDPESLYTFAREMSEFVRSIDRNHLVSLGTIGTGQPGTQNSNFARLHSIPFIGAVGAHDYGHNNEPWPASFWNSVGTAYRTSVVLGKPFFIGEAGIKAGCEGCSSVENRAEQIEDKIEAALERGVDGYLIWQYKLSCIQDLVCFTDGDPLIRVIEKYSFSMPRS